MVSNPVDYVNAFNQLSVFLAHSQGKSNLLWTWLLAETPLRLEPLLIHGMHDASSAVVEDLKVCNYTYYLKY